MPAREREWLSWTNSASIPSSRHAGGAEGLDQEAALVAVDRRARAGRAPSSSVSSRVGHQTRAECGPVLALVVLAVLAGADRLPPPLVVAIPVDGALDALVEADRRLPAERLGLARTRASSGGRGRGGR